MKRCNIDCQFLSEFDLFGKEPELYFKGKPQRTSKIGKALTYLYIILYIAFFIYKIIRMLQKVDITFYETYAYSGTPSIKLNNNIYYGGFSLNGLMDETIYYPVCLYYEEARVNGKLQPIGPPKQLELEKCKLEKFGEKYRPIFKDKDLDNFYCLKDVEQITLEGYSHLETYKYLYVIFYPCIGYAPDGRECKDQSEVTNFFAQGAKITFNIQDIELTPHIYDTPSQPLERDIAGPAFLTLYQQIYTYLQIVILETDEDVIGFEGLSNVVTQQQFLKYDESWIVAAPSPHAGGLVSGFPMCEVTVQLSAKVLTQKRKNTKLIEVLGDVGGLMEVVWSALNILATVITDILYDKALVNNLFSFDLDKKIVRIKKMEKKNEQNNNLQLNEGPKIYSPKASMNNIQSGFNTNQNENDYQIKSKFNKDNLKNENKMAIKMKRKRKIKSKGTMNSISRNTEASHKNLEEDNLRSPNEIYIPNERENISPFNMDMNLGMPSEVKNMNKETERIQNKNSENRRIIDRINMNCCCIYFWFCFARKKKNIQNILLDEGMNVIAENLDIMNIFNKIYIADIIGQSLKKNENIFDMSDTCKQKLQDLVK